MGTRAELEAALAAAQADWRRANDELDKAQAERAKANAIWDGLIAGQSNDDNDRRGADEDRRRADEIHDKLIPDQRNSDADRRKAGADLAVFVRTVAERHKIFVERNNAETAWANAAAELIAAIARRKSASAALGELNRAENET